MKPNIAVSDNYAEIPSRRFRLHFKLGVARNSGYFVEDKEHRTRKA